MKVTMPAGPYSIRAMLTPPLDIIARDLPHDGVELRTGGRGEHVGDVIVGVNVVT